MHKAAPLHYIYITFGSFMYISSSGALHLAARSEKGGERGPPLERRGIDLRERFFLVELSRFFLKRVSWRPISRKISRKISRSFRVAVTSPLYDISGSAQSDCFEALPTLPIVKISRRSSCARALSGGT